MNRSLFSVLVSCKYPPAACCIIVARHLFVDAPSIAVAGKSRGRLPLRGVVPWHDYHVTGSVRRFGSTPCNTTRKIATKSTISHEENRQVACFFVSFRASCGQRDSQANIPSEIYTQQSALAIRGSIRRNERRRRSAPGAEQLRRVSSEAIALIDSPDHDKPRTTERNAATAYYRGVNFNS